MVHGAGACCVWIHRYEASLIPDVVVAKSTMATSDSSFPEGVENGSEHSHFGQANDVCDDVDGSNGAGSRRMTATVSAELAHFRAWQQEQVKKILFHYVH